MKVVANHQCPTCKSCYRKHIINEEGKKVTWCGSPICADKDVRVLVGRVVEKKDK